MTRRGRPPHPDVLTPREWEVLALIREGLSNEGIAGRLGISLDGVKYHVSEILGKLGLENRSEAARWRRGQRPWWVAAFTPLLFWRRGTGWLSGTITGGLVVALAAGVVALVLALRSTGDGASGPAALPASDRLAYVGTDGDLWLLEDDVTSRLTEDSQVSDLSWSPDGRYVLFLRGADRSGDARGGPPPTLLLEVAHLDSGKLSMIDYGPSRLDGYAGEATWSSAGKIAYVTSTGLEANDPLWVVDWPGAERRELLPGSFAVRDFGWSPDGSRLAVTRSEFLDFLAESEGSAPPETDGLYVVDQASGETHAVALLPSVQAAYEEGERVAAVEPPLSALGVAGVAGVQWSPDGEFIAFQASVTSASASADGAALFTVPAEGGTPVYHGVMLHSKALLDWFPKGHRFAFTLGRGRDVSLDKRIAIAEAGSPEATIIGPDAVRSDAWPAVSPDGRRIAFQASEAGYEAVRLDVGKIEGPREGIWVADVDGSNPRQLTSDPAYIDFLPRWSADGESIVFIRTDGEPFVEGGTPSPEAHAEAWIVRADGSSARPLLRDLGRLDSYYGLFDWDSAVAWHRAIR